MNVHLIWFGQLCEVAGVGGETVEVDAGGGSAAGENANSSTVQAAFVAAAGQGHLPVAEHLLAARGAEARRADAEGRRPLHNAAWTYVTIVM